MASKSFSGESPAETPSYTVRLYSTATEFLDVASKSLFREEISSNIILAHAEAKCVEETSAAHPPAKGGSHQAPLTNNRASLPAAVTPSFWLVVWTETPDPQPLLFLSCTSWKLGPYPIFLWSPKTNIDIAPEERNRQVRALAQYLRNQVEPQRVFSVFGQTTLVTVFVELWKEETGFVTEPEPFYDAFLTFCTRDTFKPFPASVSSPNAASELPSAHSMRIATMDDLQSVTERCKEFSDDTVRIGP